MSLADAKRAGAEILPLPEGPPYPCSELHEWAGGAFWMKPSDPRLEALHHGGSAPTPPLENLQGLVRAWSENPEWLDFLDPSAPNHKDKLLERAMYLHHWERWLPSSGRVLDLGGGCGRFTAALLDRGLDVEVVDPDLRSLWRTLQHASGRPGRVDLHWATGETMPELEPVDAVLAAEVLCYCEDPQRILRRCFEMLKPGGVILASVEARWGWASSLDVPPGCLESLLSDGVVHVPGDLWVRTYEQEDLQALLSECFDVERMLPTHYTLSGPFEAAAGPLDLPALLELEGRLRKHPQTAHLNRAWLAVARKIDGRKATTSLA